ncbi:MAK10-like protein [Tanacetum coccineum]|uniref:MAK10-like protein n=1 Tax=Tanacetum coccineum TaxID=301880 RepID=A0ABQ5H1M1_9ASTR
MHNNIMAAGSKDRPPMLGPGRYSQWRSRFLRYEIIPDLATRAIETPLSSPMGTMWCLSDPTPSASNWLECLPAGSISTWEDLTTLFHAQFFPPGRTPKLQNDILMFQQHQGESLSETWTRFKDLLHKVPHYGIDLWLQVQIFYDHINPATRRTIYQLADAIANVVIDCKKAKITVGEGVTRSIFRVKEIDLGDEEVPYCTTLGKRESYEPRPSTDGIGARPSYYAKKYFMDYHLPGEWKIARDAEPNPFKDVLGFRKMIEFLGAIPINLKGNMWKSEELIENRIYWNMPLKKRDGAWHLRIELIDPDGEKFNKTFRLIPTTRKLSEKENPSKIIDLDHFHNS